MSSMTNDKVWVPGVGVVERNAPCPVTRIAPHDADGCTCGVCDGFGCVPVVRFLPRTRLIPAGAELVGPDWGDAVAADINETGSVYVGSAGWEVHGNCSPPNPISGPHTKESAADALRKYRIRKHKEMRDKAAYAQSVGVDWGISNELLAALESAAS